MVFELDQFGSFRKLIDFNSRATDDGFYFYPGNDIGFFNLGSGTTAVATPTFVNVVLTRDGSSGTIAGYLNGVSQFAVADNGGLGTFRGSDNSIHFFEDDAATGFREASTGSVDCIRIYNTALSSAAVAGLSTCLAAVVTPPTSNVPEPGSMALVFIGAAGVVLSNNRRRLIGRVGKTMSSDGMRLARSS
jgi:hypothetical protein